MNRAAISFVVLLLAFAVAAEAAEQPEIGPRVDGIFASFAADGSPGVAVAVIHDGSAVFEKGYGLANLELDVPITPRSVFYLGSVSKQFVAASIALLERDGKLSLDDDIRKYVPELPDYGTPITVRHLVHHTSGLRDYLTLMNLADLPLGTFHDNQGVVDLLARQQGLNFDPGSRYMYSNSGYLLLAVIVEKAGGRSLREYAQEKIFGPLGMKHTHFHDDYMHLIPNRASGYFFDPLRGYRNFLSTFDRVGSGGVFSSVEDLVLWDRNFYDGKVGGESFLARMHQRGKLSDGTELDYAFGLVIDEHRGLRRVQHGGALGGYRSMLMRFPEEHLSVIVLANVNTAGTSDLATQVADLFLADRYAEADETADAAPDAAEGPAPAEVSAKDLARLAGQYWNAEDGNARRIFVNDEGVLMYGRGADGATALAPVDAMHFRMVGVGAAVDVVFDEWVDGAAGRMTVTVDGREETTLERYEPLDATPEYLATFAGTYHSVELLVDYTASVKDGSLVAAGPKGAGFPLTPGPDGVFTARGASVRFTRGEDGQVDGFVLDAGRANGLRFERK